MTLEQLAAHPWMTGLPPAATLQAVQTHMGGRHRRMLPEVRKSLKTEEEKEEAEERVHKAYKSGSITSAKETKRMPIYDEKIGKAFRFFAKGVWVDIQEELD